VKHLRDYIARFAATGTVENLIAAQTRLGQELWSQACPVTTVDGQCVKMQRERATRTDFTRSRRGSDLQTQCGESSKAKVTFVPRNTREVAAATVAFRQALATFQAANTKMTDAQRNAASYYVGLAQFHIAEIDFETYIAMTFPNDLNFDQRKPSVVAASRKRFDQWLVAKQKLGVTTRDAYEAVFAFKEASNSIAAAARVGQIMQSLSDQLYSAPIPNDIRQGEFAEDKVSNYCEALTAIAEPLEKKAIAEYAGCLRKSTELGWFSSWSKLCERELGQLRPKDFPSAFELRSLASRLAPVTTTETAMTLAVQ
jgi:hypothetical protein